MVKFFETIGKELDKLKDTLVTIYPSWESGILKMMGITYIIVAPFVCYLFFISLGKFDMSSNERVWFIPIILLSAPYIFTIASYIFEGLYNVISSSSDYTYLLKLDSLLSLSPFHNGIMMSIGACVSAVLISRTITPIVPDFMMPLITILCNIMILLAMMSYILSFIHISKWIIQFTSGGHSK